MLYDYARTTIQQFSITHCTVGVIFSLWCKCFVGLISNQVIASPCPLVRALFFRVTVSAHAAAFRSPFCFLLKLFRRVAFDWRLGRAAQIFFTCRCQRLAWTFRSASACQLVALCLGRKVSSVQLAPSSPPLVHYSDYMCVCALVDELLLVGCKHQYLSAVL